MEEVVRKALTSLCKTEILLFLLAFNHTIQSQSKLSETSKAFKKFFEN